MNWTDITTKLPEQTGPYSVSISRKIDNRHYVFTYVSYYDKENNKWYKYNPFVDNSKEEEITDQILGWIENSTTYIGR